MNAPWKSGVAGTRDPFTHMSVMIHTRSRPRVCEEMGWSQDKAYRRIAQRDPVTLGVHQPTNPLVDLSESGDPIAT